MHLVVTFFFHNGHKNEELRKPTKNYMNILSI
jgi:hypothetical protein